MIRKLRRTWSRIVGVWTGHRHEAEVAEEFETHIQMLTDENLRQGMRLELARREAALTFGGLTAAKESYRDQHGLPWLENLQRDIRYALRGLRRSPGFTAVAVASLALGIGANTAVFSVANAVILRALPVRDPGELVLFRYEDKSEIPAVVRRTQVGDHQDTFPYRVYEAFRPGTETLSDVIAFVPLGMNQQSLTMQVGGQTTVAGGEMVSGNYFRVLGVSPILGRAIHDEDMESGAPNVAVVSHDFWLRELGGEPSAIGRSITVNKLPFTVVGVAPPGFFGINPAMPPDIWISLRDLKGIKPWGRLRPGPGGLSPFADKGYWWCHIVGRLKPGIPSERVLSEVNIRFREGLTSGLGDSVPADRLPQLSLASARRGLDNLRQNLAEPIWILMTAVSLVLLVACSNVATLLLARSKSREREILVRLGLGAGRCRLVSQLLTESILLSLCGGAAGLLLAWLTSDALVRLFGGGQTNLLDVRPDITVLAFVAIVSLLTGSLIGLAPAVRATRVNLAPQLNATGCSSPRLTLSRFLVVCQATLAVVLLFNAGLFVRTLQNLDNQDLGFDRNNLLLFEIDPRRAGVTPDRTVDIYHQALQEIQTSPGVRSVSVSATALLSGNTDGGPVATDGPPAPRANEACLNVMGPGFTETMGIRVLRGRGIDWRDVREPRSVAVVNEAMARKFFGNQDPLGRRISFEVPFNPQSSFQIVGVVGNAKYDGMRSEPPPTAYLPYGAVGNSRIARMCFAVRSTGDPLSLVPVIRETMRSIDPALPMMDIRTQSSQINRALEHERVFAGLSSLFGILALLLVALGLYGTLAYAVARRTVEIGIRIALGATRLRVLWMVLRESLVLAGCGVLAGLPAALALGGLTASRLFGVGLHDTLTIAVTVGTLLATAAVAGFVPAHRACHIDPLLAIRHE
ncbi:MAG: ADOP family duplicated permease [Acidobacteriota bacterium]